jgi:ABC-type antimicrobial peptide transport system permease subunit
MNTMLMATFERVREFGLIKALGASPWRIVRDVAAEALVLGMTATLLGGGLGLAVGLYLQTAGLDTSAFAGSYTIAGVAFDPTWRAVVSLESVLVPILAMWGTCLLASLYPAVIAARLDPVRAMQHV